MNWTTPARRTDTGWQLPDGRTVPGGFMGGAPRGKADEFVWLHVQERDGYPDRWSGVRRREISGSEITNQERGEAKDAYAIAVQEAQAKTIRELCEAINRVTEQRQDEAQIKMAKWRAEKAALEFEESQRTIEREKKMTETNDSKKNENKTGADETIADLFRHVASEASEGAKDGTSFAISKAAASSLATLAINRGAPAEIARHPWVTALLTLLAPVLILLALRIGGDTLPSRVRSLEAIAIRAIRGLAAHYGSTLVQLVVQWLDGLVDLTPDPADREEDAE